MEPHTHIANTQPYPKNPKQLGVYLHLSAYQFVDTRRSDFWEMFVHHLATIGLIVFSWMSWCVWRAWCLWGDGLCVPVYRTDTHTLSPPGSPFRITNPTPAASGASGRW